MPRSRRAEPGDPEGLPSLDAIKHDGWRSVFEALRVAGLRPPASWHFRAPMWLAASLTGSPPPFADSSGCTTAGSTQPAFPWPISRNASSRTAVTSARLDARSPQATLAASVFAACVWLNPPPKRPNPGVAPPVERGHAALAGPPQYRRSTAAVARWHGGSQEHRNGVRSGSQT